MNCTVYLFGKFGQGITSSVNDYTKSMFDQFISYSEAPTQIIIHRNGAIMNYGYVRKIANNHLFGICAQINGQYISHPQKLFEVFENIISNIAIRGDILGLNRKGEVESTVSHFTDKPNETDSAIAISINEFTQLSYDCISLPPLDFSAISNEIYRYNERDDNEEIAGASVKNGYTFIFKSKDFDTLSLKGYCSTLSVLNKENDDYKKKNLELGKQLKELEQKKKQMNVVVILFAILFIGSIIFFSVIEDKNLDIKTQQNRISQLETKCKDYVTLNTNLSNEKSALESQNLELENKLNVANKSLDDVKQRYKSLSNKYGVLSQQAEQHKNSINQLERDKQSLSSQLRNVNSELYRVKSNYSSLQSNYNTLKYKYDGLVNKQYQTREGRRGKNR